MAFTRCCVVKVDITKIPDYLEKLRERETESQEISPNSKMLIDKVIRYHKGKIEPLLNDTRGEITAIEKELGNLRDMDEKINTDLEDCCKVVTEYLMKHNLEKFERRVFRKSLDEKVFHSPVSEVAVAVSVSREDHCGSLRDLATRIENSQNLQPNDKEILSAVIKHYGNDLECKCKVEDSYAENIKSKVEQLHVKLKPVYDNLQQMQTWIYQLKSLDEVEG